VWGRRCIRVADAPRNASSRRTASFPNDQGALGSGLPGLRVVIGVLMKLVGTVEVWTTPAGIGELTMV
jgi:hypothetical protein